MPIDLLIGDMAIRRGVESGTMIPELEAGWQGELEEFNKFREAFLLY